MTKKIKLIHFGFSVNYDYFVERSEGDRYPQYQGMNVIWRQINGFERYLDSEITLIGVCPAATYPKSKYILFPTFNWKRPNSENENITCGYINIIIFKHITRVLTLTKNLISVIKKINFSKNDVLFIYSLHSPFLISNMIAKLICNYKAVLMVPDLPNYMNNGRSTGSFFRALKLIDSKIIELLIGRVDCYIVNTKQSKLNFEEKYKKPALVVEGMVDFVENFKNSEKNNYFHIVYSGALNDVDTLVAVLKHFNKKTDFKVTVTGMGDKLKFLIDEFTNSENIKILGVVKKNELIEIQKSANLLINLQGIRSPGIDFSFPSKILEYMSMGRNILTTKLPGIPEDYYKYIYGVDSNVDEIIEKIVDISKLPHDKICELENTIFNYASEYKNKYYQSEKIMKFIEGIK